MTQPQGRQDEERANLLAGTCAHECKTTWGIEHGGALPGGPFPGDHAREGDVRVCEHGALWEFDTRESTWRMNHWTRLSRFWEHVCATDVLLACSPLLVSVR